MNAIVGGYIVPYMPHPLLVPERNQGWQALRHAFEQAQRRIAASEADLLLIYSTRWTSVIGHQIQADPTPEWVQVDQEWHDLGEIPYRLRMDADFAQTYETCAKARGLQARTVAYRGFPIDTGTLVALKLLNPDNRLAASVVSCNMYADRGETLVLGKAARDAIERTGKRAICVAVTALSNRLHTEMIDPAEDCISSLKDDEWNRKILQILGEGRLEDVSQLSRQFYREANADSKFKALWWLAALMGQHNRYDGEVLEYQPVWGTGAALVSLTPTMRGSRDQEFDEDDVEHYSGERQVLSGLSDPQTEPSDAVSDSTTETPVAASSRISPSTIHAEGAPKPVGAYPHARRIGDMLYLSGVGPRQAGSDAIAGGPVWDAQGRELDYDIEAQARAVINNVRCILEAAGSGIDRVVDVTVFLINMRRDFETFNRVYAETFASVQATRTTLEVRALPTPIAIEFKVIAEV